LLKRVLFLAVLILAATASRAQTRFVYDTFTGTTGTFLESHSPDTGGAWSRVRGAGITLVSNTARPDKNQSNDIYLNAATPSSAEYAVGITVTFVANNADNVIELYARASATLLNGYGIRLDALGNYTITRYIGGTPTVLASGTTTALNPRNTPNEIIFFVTDAAKRLIVNGTIVATITDNTVTTAGTTGFGLVSKTPNDAIADNFYASTLGPTVVKMDSMSATRDGDRVLLSWTTGREADNLGYRIWRDTGRTRVCLTPSPIAGSAFFVNAPELASGTSYRWLDRRASRGRGTYWIEEIDLNGAREWHGPIAPAEGSIDERVIPTATLAQLSQRNGVATISDGLQELRSSNSAQTNFQVAASAAMKILVTAPGIQELAVPAGADPRRLQLFADGVEVPVLVAGNTVRFYGLPLDTTYSGTRVYWLTWERGTGMRFDAKPSNKTLPLHTASGFLATVERRDQTIYDARLVSEDGDGFFGPLITTEPARQVLRLEHVNRPVAAAELALTILGVTRDAHRISVTVNGNAAGTIDFEGAERQRSTLTVQSAWLRDGDNEIALAAPGGDVSVLEATRITYSRKYHAADGTLVFTAPGGTRVPVAGFTGNVVALDITDPGAPVLLASEGGTIAVRGSGVRTIIAAERVLRPATEANVPSTLHKARADMLMIAPRAFLSALAPLAGRRGAVVLAAIEDVYDEFSFGAKDPAAIREFIRTVKPRAVLLTGDGSFDPRNYAGGGAADIIPVQLVASARQRTPSDAWYSDFDADGVAEVAIGRLPARTVADLQTMVAKIIAYETAAAPSTEKLFVNGAGFAQPNAQINVDTEGITAARQNLLQRWSQGPALVNFFGHGSVEMWQSASFFSRADAAALTNAQLPLVVAMTCLNAYFHDVNQESLGETLLLNPNGGAVGVWALSTLTEPSGQLRANEALLAALAEGRTLGEATIAAQRATSDADVRRTLVLFGDPMMKMR
jgi:Peptidase family C25